MGGDSIAGWEDRWSERGEEVEEEEEEEEEEENTEYKKNKLIIIGNKISILVESIEQEVTKLLSE